MAPPLSEWPKKAKKACMKPSRASNHIGRASTPLLASHAACRPSRERGRPGSPQLCRRRPFDERNMSRPRLEAAMPRSAVGGCRTPKSAAALPPPMTENRTSRADTWPAGWNRAGRKVPGWHAGALSRSSGLIAPQQGPRQRPPGPVDPALISRAASTPPGTNHAAPMDRSLRKPIRRASRPSPRCRRKKSGPSIRSARARRRAP